jgi:hypothetical protein
LAGIEHPHLRDACEGSIHYDAHERNDLANEEEAACLPLMKL